MALPEKKRKEKAEKRELRMMPDKAGNPRRLAGRPSIKQSRKPGKAYKPSGKR